MKYLFIDNYRGFTNTLIPLRQVTFLVGENSTGKTSIMSIIHLLSDYKFWFEQQFNSKEVQLGTFRDIVSAGSLNSSTFSIGNTRDRPHFPPHHRKVSSGEQHYFRLQPHPQRSRLILYTFLAAKKENFWKNMALLNNLWVQIRSFSVLCLALWRGCSGRAAPAPGGQSHASLPMDVYRDWCHVPGKPFAPCWFLPLVNPIPFHWP